jgi:hypothetical protein
MAKYVRLPQLRRQHGKTVRGFNDRWGFPQCLGAIDGTHIPILVPHEYHIEYFNWKGWHSIVMQAVVDHA